MELANAPEKLVAAWANADSTKTNPIPVSSQIGITPGAASLEDGFPPLCATPLASGGIPPAKADMNGGLYQMSAIDVWSCAGAGFPYDAAFSTAIGGYPKGARVLMASGNGFWVSTVDNNVTDPDTGGAGWASADENSITALTDDVTASGPGSASATLKTVNTSPGTYTGPFTVNGKGLVTSASNVPFTGSSGYQKLPSGLILQFFRVTSIPSGGATTTTSFPEAFPTACLFCIPVAEYDGNTIDSPVASKISNTASSITYCVNAASGSIPVSIFAIGY